MWLANVSGSGARQPNTRFDHGTRNATGPNYRRWLPAAGPMWQPNYIEGVPELADRTLVGLTHLGSVLREPGDLINRRSGADCDRGRNRALTARSEIDYDSSTSVGSSSKPHKNS